MGIAKPIITAMLINLSGFNAGLPSIPVYHSAVLSDKHNYGSIGDLSLSGNRSSVSMSIWIKLTGGSPGLSIMGNNKSTTGTGGSSLILDSLFQFEMMAENVAFAPAWSPSVATDGVFGLVSTASPGINDGGWHNLIGTYTADVIGRTCLSIIDSTHLSVDDTTGINPGDRIYYHFTSTVVISVVDIHQLEVASTTGWNVMDGRFVARGVHIYLDGVEFTTFNDFEFTLFLDQFSCDIPFGIGDPEQINYFSVVGKYAYPAIYNRVLTSSEAATIASGHNVTTGAVGQWLFTEGAGLTAQDSSGNGRTLTFNAVSWDTDVPFTP